MRSILTALLVTFVLVGLVECGGSAKPPEKAVIALYNFPGTAALHVAIEKGYFRDEGLDVTADSYDTGRLALEAAVEGKADFATVADTPIAGAVLDGKPVSIIATVCKVERVISIVARRDRGISSFSDLKGKVVGVAAGSVSEFALHAYLVAFNVDPKDVQIVSVTPDKFIDALVDGEVDAISLAAPHRVILQERLGENAVLLDDPAVATNTMNVVVTQEFARSNPERIERFLRAMVRAKRFIQARPDEAHAISASYIGSDSPLYEKEWPDYKFELDLNQSLLMNLEVQARWMIDQGDSALEMPNFLDFIDADGLKAVQPDAVNIAGK